MRLKVHNLSQEFLLHGKYFAPFPLKKSSEPSQEWLLFEIIILKRVLATAIRNLKGLELFTDIQDV
jgi:hypothetical protein